MLGTDGTSGIDENRHHRRRATAARADAPRAEQLPSRQLPGAVAEWLSSGLQSRVHRFDSGRRLSMRAVDAPARARVRPYSRAKLPTNFGLQPTRIWSVLTFRRGRLNTG